MGPKSMSFDIMSARRFLRPQSSYTAFQYDPGIGNILGPIVADLEHRSQVSEWPNKPHIESSAMEIIWLVTIREV